MMRSIIIALAAGFSLSVCFSQAQRSGTLNLCTVAANVRAYNGQQVRVTAFLGVGAEQDVLYDPKCQDGKPLVFVSFKPNATGEMKALRQIVEKKRYALVTVEGIMHGGEPVKIDPNLPDWLKDRFKDSSERYGHLGSLDMMIEIGKVVEAKDVDDGLKPEKSGKRTP